jgi:hypothetical protein
MPSTQSKSESAVLRRVLVEVALSKGQCLSAVFRRDESKCHNVGRQREVDCSLPGAAGFVHRRCKQKSESV